MRTLKVTPYWGRVYLLIAALLLALPSMAGLYKGQTGKLLVVSPLVTGEPFEKSVVYIHSHDFFHAFGVIVNRPLEDAEVREIMLPLAINAPLYDAGPMDQPGFMTGMYSDGGKIILGKEGLEGKDFRVMVGYAGWSALHLNSEIVRGLWDVIDADPDLVFNTPPERMWDAAREKVLSKMPVEDKGIL